MEKPTASKDMSLDDIRMSSDDLLEKKELDCGGFGKVYLCCHKNHGLVVLKTVFTGIKHDSYKNDLFQEGKIMCRLNHMRVVKLLGVILEDCNYSLVIEFMTKGNLLNILQKVRVPIPLKARFILEIIEGMVYLHSQKVIHKDLKPENILADDDFHVKIADLGVAAFQKWSTLTKEETKRQKSQSRKNCSANSQSAGTLSYMAPEHFKDINKKATEKSDVYSFGIVIWVILSNKEPYENVINYTQFFMGVQNGQRPDMTEDIKTCLKEATDLMQKCWCPEANERPSFEECEKLFRPVYTEKYKKSIHDDVAKFQKDYPSPEAFIERMASLQLDCDAEAPSMPQRDTLPRSLHSCQGLEQINENSFRPSNQPEESEEERPNEILQQKLQEEINYHQTGSRIDNMPNLSNPDTVTELRSRKVFNKPSDVNQRTPGNFVPFNGPHSTQQSLQAAQGYNEEYIMHPSELYGQGRALNNVENILPNEPQRFHPTIPPVTPETEPNSYDQYGPYGYGYPGSVPQDSTKIPVAESGMPSFYPTSNVYDSNVSHMGGTPGTNYFPKGNFGYTGSYAPSSYITDKAVNLTISNSRAIQIGNGNYMSVEESPVMKRNVSQNLNHEQYLHVFESHALVNEQQLQLLRENLSKKWKEFARKVGFRQPDIEEIDHDYERDGLKEKVFQMLHKWQMKEGSKNTTVGKIAKALYDCAEIDLLNQLIRLS